MRYPYHCVPSRNDLLGGVSSEVVFCVPLLLKVRNLGCGFVCGNLSTVELVAERRRL